MKFEDEKKALIKSLNEMMSCLGSYEANEIKKLIQELSDDLHNDFNTVVVIGEFKNGKSTFINSLLGQSLLPVDVTPTTATINAVMWGEEESLSVHRSDGNIERYELTKEALEEYVAEKDFDPDMIDYLKVMLPLAQLKEQNVVLIDTPGVNDLNTHRSEVTYKFIPKADVVLFLLDMTSPVRNTEKIFIKDSLLDEGLDRIIYLANFLDHLEEDEVETTMSYIKDRLSEIMGGKEVRLYPLSAQIAVDAVKDGNKELLEWSGLPKVKEAISSELANGDQTGERLKRYKQRIDKIYQMIEKDIDQKNKLHSHSIDELNQSLSFIQESIEDKERNESKIRFYVEDRLNEFLLMINKSLKTFSDNLREDIKELIQGYKSADFKEFIEVQLPAFVKKKCKRWIEDHLEQMNDLLYKLEQALAKGLAKEFNTKIVLSIENNLLLKMDEENFQLTANDLSNTNVLAGAIAGGAGMLMMVFGGPILLPLVSMAGYPLLQKKLMEKRLTQAKEYLSTEIDSALDEVMKQFQKNITNYFKQYVWQIETEAIRLFDVQLNVMKKNIEFTIKERATSKNNIQEQINQLTVLKETLGNLKHGYKIAELGGIR